LKKIHNAAIVSFIYEVKSQLRCESAMMQTLPQWRQVCNANVSNDKVTGEEEEGGGDAEILAPRAY
jgi:hypothetical protein